MSPFVQIRMLAALGCLAHACTAAAAEPAVTWAGSATLASDYVYRGVSQSQRKPVLQLDIEASHRSGIYAGVFGSNVDYTAPGDDADGIARELSLRAGWRIPVDWGGIDLAAQRTLYPGARAGFGAAYTEYAARIDYGAHVALRVAHAPDYYALGGAATDYGIDVGGERGALSVWLGAGYVDQDALAGTGYSYVDLVASHAFARWRLDVGWSRAFDYSAAIAEINGPASLARGHWRAAIAIDVGP